jgi:hypothetical protein
MRFLWSDRGSGWKVGVTILIVTALCWYAHRAIGPRYPSIGEIRANPTLHEGRVTILPPTPLASGGEGAFHLEKNGSLLEIRAKGSWSKGEFVGVRGIVHNGAVDAEIAHRYPGFTWKRSVMYGVSILLSLFLLGRLLRRTDLRHGIFESRG